MSFLMTILSFVFVLAIVVVVHELGHYWVGRWFGVGVTSFSFGFGPEIAGWTDKHGTRWKVSAVPLGGYVKFHGDANAASVPDTEADARMSDAERATSLQHKPVGQRAAVVAAGPIANFLLAILIFAGTLLIYGKSELLPRVESVVEGSAAEKAGFRPNDLILEIQGKSIRSFAELQRIVNVSADQPLAIKVERGGVPVTLTATPALREVKSALGTQRIGILGLRAANRPEDIKTRSYGLLEAINEGIYETWFIVERTGAYIGGLFAGRESADQISGPIQIAKISGVVATAGIGALLTLAAVLSVSVGLINLLPVPMLDGGHLLFYAIEAVRGRPLSETVQEYGFRFGLALVLALMVFATWNDILKLQTP
ncbi:MAG: RIP metalloprotease RseP [Beijerinckiaceae bacterium]